MTKIFNEIQKLSRVANDETSWRPEIFDITNSENLSKLESLIYSGKVYHVADRLEDQLKELLTTQNPSKTFSNHELDDAVKRHLNGLRIEEYGRWVFYPWKGLLVHVLPKKEYQLLRCDRNRYKITEQEQKKLRKLKIGIAGLSVGRFSALTLALEGVGGHYRLADFDLLELSNMNRLLTTVENLGVNKAILAARDMYGIDPYLEIEIYPEGLDETNIDNFICQQGKLDLIIEECDDLYMKFFIREKAKKNKIPVIMDTNERGMLDVERFDTAPDRPVFHGLLNEVKAGSLKGLSHKEKAPYVMRIIGEKTMTDRQIKTMQDVKKTVSSWSQLGSGAVLGGALVTDTVRRIFLKEFTASGRFFVDLANLIHDTDGSNQIDV